MGVWGALHRGLDRLGELPGLRHGRQFFYDRAFLRASAEDRMFRGVFQTSEEAQASAPAGRRGGYDHPESADFGRKWEQRLYPTDYPLMFWLQSALHDGARSIVDFGGNIGVKFYAYRRYIEFPADLRWQVIELPAIAEAGRQRAAEQGIEDMLSFLTELRQVQGADLLFASGSLQYLSVGVADLLRTMPELPQRVVVNATPVHPNKTYYTLNSIGHAYCAYRITGEPEILDGMQALGYTLRDRWKHPDKDCRIAFDREHSLHHYCGFAFMRG
jgi:putative methyltransferase (TIGR04325 family)